MAGIAGHALNALPRQLRIEDEDARTCCAVAECFACCYAVDVGCTLPFMAQVEEGDDRYNVRLFAFYEACWPCLWCARAFGWTNNEQIRTLPRRMGLQGFRGGEEYNALTGLATQRNDPPA